MIIKILLGIIIVCAIVNIGLSFAEKYFFVAIMYRIQQYTAYVTAIAFLIIRVIYTKDPVSNVITILGFVYWMLVSIDFCDAYKEMQESEDFEGDDIVEEPEDDEDSKK